MTQQERDDITAYEKTVDKAVIKRIAKDRYTRLERWPVYRPDDQTIIAESGEVDWKIKLYRVDGYLAHVEVFKTQLVARDTLERLFETSWNDGHSDMYQWCIYFCYHDRSVYNYYAHENATT